MANGHCVLMTLSRNGSLSRASIEINIGFLPKLIEGISYWKHNEEKV